MFQFPIFVIHLCSEGMKKHKMTSTTTTQSIDTAIEKIYQVITDKIDWEMRKKLEQYPFFGFFSLSIP